MNFFDQKNLVHFINLEKKAPYVKGEFFQLPFHYKWYLL